MSEKSQLIEKLSKSRKTREAYIRAKVSANVPSQIRALRRRQNDMTQKELAFEAEMKQSRISAMERPGTRFNLETLVRLAAAFKVGLMVKFVSFSEMLDWENGFSQDEFNVTNLDADDDFRRDDAPAGTWAPQLRRVVGNSAWAGLSRGRSGSQLGPRIQATDDSCGAQRSEMPIWAPEAGSSPLRAGAML